MEEINQPEEDIIDPFPEEELKFKKALKECNELLNQNSTHPDVVNRIGELMDQIIDRLAGIIIEMQAQYSMQEAKSKKLEEDNKESISEYLNTRKIDTSIENAEDINKRLMYYTRVYDQIEKKSATYAEYLKSKGVL